MTGASILVADDDKAIRTVITQALGRKGYDVRTTGNTATLWRWISDGEGDLVITDVVMPDENGLDLIPRIRKIRPNLRILVMSADPPVPGLVERVDLPLMISIRDNGEGIPEDLHACLFDPFATTASPSLMVDVRWARAAKNSSGDELWPISG